MARRGQTEAARATARQGAIDKAKAAKKEVGQLPGFPCSCCIATVFGRRAIGDLHIPFTLASCHLLLKPCSSFSEGGREEEACGTDQVLCTQGLQAADEGHRSWKAAQSSGVNLWWCVRVSACLLACAHSSLPCIFFTLLLQRYARCNVAPLQFFTQPRACRLCAFSHVPTTALMPVCLRPVRASKISPWPVDVLLRSISTMT